MYRYDLFISYRRHDLGRQWIREHFLPELSKYLEPEIDQRPRIFWDESSIDDGHVPRQDVLEALKHSICVVPVLSKYYFNSAWCSAEWKTFLDRSERIGGRSLTIPIKWHDSDDYERDFGDSAPKAGEFGDYRLTGPAWVKSELYVKFQQDIDRLARTLGKVINRPPSFDNTWPLIDPDEVGPLRLSTGEWRYKLKPQGGLAT